MSEVDQALEMLLSAALGLVSSRLYLDLQQPGASDDAQRELDLELLDDAARHYVALLNELSE